MPALAAREPPKGGGSEGPPDLKRRSSPRQGTGAPADSSRPKVAAREGETLVTIVDSIDSMILPQVHLRKPCYDFSFL